LSATNEAISFEQHIKPLFREGERQSMKWAFDLWSHDEVARNSEAITPPRRHQAGTPAYNCSDKAKAPARGS
jgi:hypothetical protein